MSEDIRTFFDGLQRRVRLQRNKDWTERWFALSLGLTVAEWRDAQRRAKEGLSPVRRGYMVPVCPKRA